MANNGNYQIEMVNMYPNQQYPLMQKSIQSAKVKHQSVPDQAVKEQLEQSQFNRVTGNIICYWIIVICTTAIPPINLLLFFIQPFQLVRGLNKQNISVQNLGRLQNFTYFYIIIGVYGFISAAFIMYSFCFVTYWQRLKYYFMVDNILICMLATDVAYAALHIVSFTAIYSTDQEYNLVPEFQVYWQDVVVIAFYCLVNLTYVGIFRILMVSIYWKPWQTIIYKLGIIVSSIAYIAIGLVYIFGYDSLSEQVNGFNGEIDPIIDYCYTDALFFDIIPFLQREQSSLVDAQNKITGFILLYVFTNFAFSFEVVAKLTDFDGTADLKTQYRLQQEQK